MLDKNVIQIIKSRKSIYPSQFSGKTLEDSIISELIDVSNHAPSHKMTQPWVYRVFTTKTKDKLLNHILNINSENFRKHQVDKMKEKFQLTSHIICICMKKNSHLLPEWEEIAATAMAVQNIWLTSFTMGIGCYWSSPASINQLGNYIKFKKGERCLGLLYMGYYDSKEKIVFKRDLIDHKIDWSPNFEN